jgi:pimeloyl-ACP methyl ester carboxylesterase
MDYDWRLGHVHYTVAGRGVPLVLAHGIGAGASSFEWRRNFEALADHYRVYAFDLLGFGLSERPVMNHSGRFYVQLLDDFIRSVIKQPANVIASSHTAAYAIRLASTRPERIGAMVLVNPAGMGTRDDRPGFLEGIGDTMRLPLVGDSLFYGLASRSNISRTLREDIYYNPGLVNDALIDHYYASAHQPGARYAISAFLRRELDLPISAEFKSLKQPVMVVWGADAKYTPLANARSFQEANGSATLHVMAETRQLPHDEKSDEFNRLVLDWLKPHTAEQELKVLQPA